MTTNAARMEKSIEGVRESESERTEHADNTARNSTARDKPERNSPSAREDNNNEDKQSIGYYASQTQTGGHETHSFIPGTISPIENASAVSASTNTQNEYWKALYNSRLLAMQPPTSKQESSRKDVLQPDVAYSDVQSTPRNELDFEIGGHKNTNAGIGVETAARKPKSEVTREALEESLQFMQRLFAGAADEDLAGEDDQPKQAPTI